MKTSPERARAVVPALAALAALAVSACGGGSEPQVAPSTTTAVTTTMPVVATTTPAEPRPAAPLTGLPVDDTAVLGRPALVVKIDNSDGRGCAETSRPQVGLNDADVVFEIYVEGITRFAGVFHSKLPETVGPVRSARSSDVDILPVLSKPLFAWSGNNSNVASDLRKIRGSYVNVGYEQSPWSNRYYRVNDGRCAPHNLFVNPPDLMEASSEGQPPSPLFPRRAATAPIPDGQGVASEGVRLTAGYEVTFTWNATSKRWERHQNGSPHLTADGQTLGADNLVVLAVTYKQSSTPGSLQAVTVGEGRAFVYMDGKVVEGTWSRPSADAPWSLADGAGRAIELSPGRTWVHFAVKGKYQDLSVDSLSA